MCGICGKLTFDGTPVVPETLARMCDTLAHRGPDDDGALVDGPIGLGQRRLSIIDLRQSATAPLANEDDSVWVVFNGEIYNFRELRRDLQARGHTFRTLTDTEVLVHLYEEYGPRMVERLRGMFAFALWDVKRRTLFAARDRLGKKPFAYAKSEKAFWFGSEIKAITADPDVPVSPDLAAIDLYLTYQYVPSPHSAFVGVRKLPAGHFLTCTAAGELRVERYWSPPAGGASDAPREALEAGLVERLREAVRLRLISEVPLGAFLSGGIDSSVVVALMAELSDAPVKTFSIGFSDDAFNELPYARLVAQRYATDHHELVVEPDAVAVLPTLVRHFNEPFADPSALPTFYVSRFAREHVTVALTGDGGDESFSGYEHYRFVARWGSADRVPRPLRRALGAFGALARPGANRWNWAARAERAVAMIAGDLPDRYRLQHGQFKPQEKRSCYSEDFRQLVRDARRGDPLCAVEWTPSMDPLAWMMRHDQQFYLPDCLMVKADIASMANSLELRAPFLDHEFVEFAASIPSAMKRDAAGGKSILKSAVASLLPPELLRKRKTGFGIPVARWFRTDLAPFLRDVLLDPRASRRGLFEARRIERMVAEHIAGARDWSNRLWALVMLELWFSEFIDNRARGSAGASGRQSAARIARSAAAPARATAGSGGGRA